MQKLEHKEVKLNALHVGCGTSTVGESLLLLKEHVCVFDTCLDGDVPQRYCMQYGHVVNVDIDNAALDSMQRRWKRLFEQNNHSNNDMGQMDWRYIDFAKEETCRDALDSFYRENGCFDLVLDKSTFDCLLCAESEAVTGLLCEVYRALRVPDKIGTNDDVDCDHLVWGGVYVMITFHPVEFVREMLTTLPNADWMVEHEIIRREVEDIRNDGENCASAVQEIISRYDKQSECIISTGIRQQQHIESDSQQTSISAWSSGTFEPNENYRRTISVFTCRRLPSNKSRPSCILDHEEVRNHVEQCCNNWYKTTNPMVTNERETEISLAFANASTNDNGALELKQCYDILFTELEKEHLPFDYFLEDWEAYCRAHDDVTIEDCMTLKVALDFLREMQ